MSIMAIMGASLKDSAKSAGLVVCSPLTKANTNDIGNPFHSNFRRSNNKKKRKQLWNRSIRCHGYTANDKGMLQGSMYRRQLLLASTSLPFKPQQMLEAIPPPPNLTDYHKLANAVHEAEKAKNASHGRQEIIDVVCWPLKPSNIYKSPDELSGIVGVPHAQELFREITEKEVVTARVRRPAELKDKEEQLVLQGIEVTNDKSLSFEVYIKLGQEEDNNEEELYLGTFSHMPTRQKQRGRHNNKAASDGREKQERARRCCLRLGMNDMLFDEAESVTVKLVPTLKVQEDPIKVESIFIDYT